MEKVTINDVNEIVLDVIATEQIYVSKEPTKDELLYLTGFNDGALKVLKRLKDRAEGCSEVKE